MREAIKDYYKILGVRPDASEEKIRERWLELVKHHHPDLEPGDIEDERIKEINEAYQVLKQPLTRWEYDLQRTCERELGKSSVRRWAPLCGVLILILVAGGIYLIGTDILSELNSGQTVRVPQVSDKRVNEQSTSKAAKETIAPKVTKQEGVVNSDDKVERVAKPSVPPVVVEKIVEVPESMVKADLKKSGQGFPRAADTSRKPLPVQSVQSTKKIRIEQPARTEEQVSLKNELQKDASSGSIAETKPQPAESKLADHSNPQLVANEEEVRSFFGNYTKTYSQKDIEGFLSFFSPQAVQNQTETYEEIRRIYTRFFRQSTELSYRFEGLKVEVYENGAEAKAQFQVDQVLRAGGERKIWKGNIRWVLQKENGALRIISLDYQNQKSL